MTELNFDFSNVNPLFEGNSFLPVSDDKGWLVILIRDNGFKPTKANNGYYLELVGVGQEGPVSGVEFTMRFNTQNPEPKAVAAAYQELSAIGHVLGLPGRIGNTAELFNKPFRLVSEQQTDKEGKPTQFTQLARNGIRDVNGNKPGAKAAGPQGAPQGQGQPAIPPQQGQPPQQQNQPAQNWGGAPQGQNQPPQGQPPQNQQWGAPQGQPPQGQGAPAGMGGPQGGNPAWGAPQGQPPQQQNTQQYGAPQGAPTWANNNGQ